MSKIFHLITGEGAPFYLAICASVGASSDNLVYVTDVLLCSVRINDNVIDIDDTWLPLELGENHIALTLIRSWCVC